MNEENDPPRPESPSAKAAEGAGPEPAQAGGAVEQEEGQPGAAPGTSQDLDGEHDYVVINNFYDQVLSGPIGISPATGATLRRRSGKVTAGDVTCALRYYLPPAAHNQALSVLKDRHLVALAGPEGSGRAAGSMALARQVSADGSDLVRLPPSFTLADISAYRGFKPGQAFVLYDWSAVAADGAGWFDVDQLENRLKDKYAYLIITVDRASDAKTYLGDLVIEWCEPDPVELLDRCLTEMATPKLTAADVALLAERAGQLRWPRLVLRLAELCIDGVDAALTEMGDAERDTVATWAATKLERWEVLSVTALAFLSGAPERVYERSVAALASAEELYRLGPDATIAADLAGNEPFPQRRAALLGRTGLAAFLVERDEVMALGAEYRPGFRTEIQRKLVMAALHRHFGDELWAPVRRWLFDMADEPFGEEHLAAGSGLALLAHVAIDEVEDVYLEQWSAGPIRSRLLATDVLWTMAGDDLLAPRALRLVVGWVRDRGQERAMTAAICLGGPLGQRYPSEAIRWLWVLSQRSERISRIARTAMARLFAAEADVKAHPEVKPGRCVVPRGLLSKIRPLLALGVAVRERRAGLALANAVLATQGMTSARTAVACVVLAQPDDVGPVGELWAMVLQSAPHRGDAIVALHETLSSLAQGPSAAQAAARLGAEILPRLGPDALRSLHVALADPIRTRAVSRAVIRAFLSAASDPSANTAGRALTR